MSAPVVRIPSPRRPVGESGSTGSPGDLPRRDIPRRDIPRQDIPRQDIPREDMPRRHVSRDGTRDSVAVPAPRSAAPGPAAVPPVAIPRPRRPLPEHGPHGAPGVGGTVHPAPVAGRHRAAPGVRGRAVSPSARAFVAVARAGSLTTLVAMLVLAAAVAGLADGVAPTGPAAEVASTTLP